MTSKDLKRVYYAARNRGMDKEPALEMLQHLVRETHDTQRGDIDRFRYEINAEEQRTS